MRHIFAVLTLTYLFTLNIGLSVAQKQNPTPHNEFVTDSTSLPNDSSFETTYSFGLYSSIFYLIPQKSNFRDNYESRFPFFNSDFPPIGTELGMVYCLTHSIDLMIDIGVRNHVLKEDLGTSATISLHVFPISIMGRHAWRLGGGEIAYLGVGAAGYWARFASEMITTDLRSEPLRILKVAQNYFGFGLLGEMGFMYKIFRNNYLDLGIRYDFTRIGNPQTGGLGNIGGIRFHLRVVTYF